MELRRYLALVWKWSWLLVLGAVVGGGVAYAYLRKQPRIYDAFSSVAVNQVSSGPVLTSTDILNSQVLSRAYSQLVTSSEVLDQVANTLQISFSDTRTSVSANAAPDSQLIVVTVSSTSPATAANVANETARVFAAVVRTRQLAQTNAYQDDLKNQLSDLQTKSATLQREIIRLNGHPSELSEDERLQQLADDQIQLDSLRENVRTTQSRLFDLQTAVARGLTTIVPVGSAAVPTAPVSPHIRRDSVLGLVLGLLIATGLAALREYLDDTIKTPQDVEKASATLATLGAVTRFGRPSKEGARPLVSQQRPHAAATEAYRVIRTNLAFAQSGQSERRTVLITSARPGEGKTTTASNLAQVMAQTGARVVLVDADLRRPSVHKLFSLPNSTGLTTLFLAGAVALETLLRPTEVEGLRVLPTGPIPPNPTELLASSRMAEIITELKTVADLVVVDSPPLLGVADASVLAARVDGVVLVVDSRRTRVGALKHAAELLQRGHATIWGVVLNKLRALEGDQYYYYYSSYRSYAEPNGVVQTNGTTKKPALRQLLGIGGDDRHRHKDRK